jgi:type I restriction enzyme, S subunit
MRNAHSTFDYSCMSNSSLKTDTPLGYKQTEVGIIPEDWECVPSKEMISYLGGYAFSSRSAKSDGIRWLKIANVGVNEVKWDAESYLPNSFSENHSDYLLAESDVVMALTRPLLGEKLKVATLSKFDIPALLNQRVAKLSAKNSCNQKYIYYLVQTSDYISAMNLAMAGSDPPNIGTKTLGDILIAIPSSRDEQTAIANALSDVDALIQELEKLVAKKQAIKTATMQQLLTGRTRLPQFDHHLDGRKKGYKPSELGEIPEDWEVCDLGYAAKVQGGFAFKSDKFATQGVAIIRIGNIQSGLIDTTDLVYYPHGEQVPKQFEVFRGDALIAMSGATTGKVGIYDSCDKAYTNQRVGKFVAASNNVSMGFIHQLVSSELYKNLLESQLEQGAQPNVSSHQLETIQIRLPSDKTEQEQIALMLTEMDQDLQVLDRRLSKTRQIKQGMMQELLTGKTRLKL